MDVARRLASLALVLATVGCGTSPPPRAAPPRAPSPAPTEAAPAASPTPAPAAADEPALPGIALHLNEGYIELDARVSPRAGEWLELVACAGKSLEHESLVTV